MAFSFRVGTNWCHDFPKLARESGFYFNAHRSKVHVDWKCIRSIDIERVIRERDFQTIDDNVNNVIDYRLENEYDIKILDPNFVKLFRLTQLTVEYLLYCKQYLDHSVIILKDELKSKIENNIKLKKKISTLEDVNKQLKDKAKEKTKVIETKIGDSTGEIHKCPHCPKTFVTAMFANAHVARRHAYSSDLYLNSSPLHEQYRAETEKLHSEIKMLKERLNQAERVIQQESQKTPDNTIIDIESKKEKPESEESKYDLHRNQLIRDQQKWYKEELSSLRNILFQEFCNSRSRDNHSTKEQANKYELSAKSEQGTQEKDIQTLTNQLLERLTPDIRSMHVKLQEQENYWKSKLEYLEYQHRMDIQNLTDVLKETQLAGNRTQIEYETKVDNLEEQSKNQLSILEEQRRLLNSLSLEINNSHTKRQTSKSIENVMSENICKTATVERRRHKNHIIKSELNHDKKLKREDTSNIIVKEINSLSSPESTTTLKHVVTPGQLSKNDNFPKYTEGDVLSNQTKVEQLQTKERFQKFTQILHNMRPTRKSTISCDNTNHTNFFTKENDNRNEEIDFPDIKSNRPLLFRNSMNKFDTKNVNDKTVEDNKKVTTKKSSNEFDDIEAGSEMDSENTTSELDSETETFTASIEAENISLDKNIKLPSTYEEQKVQKTDLGLQDLQEKFRKKLLDLGIDPEWHGIPQTTFQQKMEIVHHHQNINAKRLLKYRQIKQKIVKELLQKISGRGENYNSYTLDKIPYLNTLKTNRKVKVKETINTQGKLRNESDSERLLLEQKNDIYAKFSDECNDPQAFNIVQALSTKNISDISTHNETPNYSRKTISDKNMHTQCNSSQLLEEFEKNSNGIANSKGNNMTTVMNIYNSYKDSSKIQIEGVQDLSSSPQHNKSVLKSKAHSVGSLVKKRVLFDLEQENHQTVLLSTTENSLEAEDLNDSDWHISSASDEKDTALEKEKLKSADSIILKTTQSDKIAEISRKIQEQLNIQRWKPVGAIDTMYLSYQDSGKVNDRVADITSIKGTVGTFTSPLKNSTGELPNRSKIFTMRKYPQPTPRIIREKMLKAADLESNLQLDTDIDEILQVT